jgi:alpha-glucosidase (family GH31 glycosyl hydrolase)
MKNSCSLLVTAFGFASLALAAPAQPAPASPEWQQIAPGVWKATIGQAESFTLLSAAGAEPRTDALQAMPAAAFPIDQSEVEARVINGKTMLRFPLALDEDVYGLGVDFKSIRRTGSNFQLHVDHWGGTTGRTHAPVPFYISTKGYGVLINSARYINVNVGINVRLAAKNKPPVIDRTTNGEKWTALPRSDSVEALIPAPGVEVLVFAGPTPMDAVRRYNLYCGGGALPPKWGLGFLTRTPLKYSAEEAEAEIAEFRKRNIPIDMLGLEPGWHDHAYPCSFEWDKTRFPDAKAFMAEMDKQHVHVNLWFNPYVSPTAPLYQKLLPYAGSHLVWNGIVPDYTMPEAQRIFADHLKKTVLDLGPAAGGFKIDEVDGVDKWLWPDLATFPSGHDAEQVRQTYGVMLQKLILDLYRSQNRRTLGQVRGTNAGASRFPFVIYNDNYEFGEYITAVANSAFAGVLWSPEVRGGKGEDMLRRTQAVCFSPLALYNGWASKEKLWTHESVAGHIRDVIVLRQRLLPYWYTTFAQYHYEGTPVIRPMQLIEGFKTGVKQEMGKLDANTDPYALEKIIEVKDQYMMGDALLIAPISADVKSRKVVLPAGKWYDFYTGKFAGENQTIEVSPSLATTPVFVKDGALVPMIPERQWAPGKDEVVALEIRHYGERPGALRLYDDDGETFDYERGNFSWTQLSVAKDANGAWKGSVTPEKNGRPWRYSDVTWTFMQP